MSLRVDDRRERGKSPSRSSGRDRSRSPNPSAGSSRRGRASEEPRKSSKVSFTSRNDEEEDPGYAVRAPKAVTPGLSSIASGGRRRDDSDESEEERARRPPARQDYEVRRPKQLENGGLPSGSMGVGMPMSPISGYDDDDERYSAIMRNARPPSHRTQSASGPHTNGINGLGYPDDGSGSYTSMPYGEYASPEAFEYAKVPPSAMKYSSAGQEAFRPEGPHRSTSLPDNRYEAAVREAKPKIDRKARFDVEDEEEDYQERKPRKDYDTKNREEQDVHRRSSKQLDGPPSPPGLKAQRDGGPQYEVRGPSSAGRRTSNLSLNTGLGADLGHQKLPAGAAPPASPLLEAYRGTYQSVSPIPSPIMLPSNMDDELPSLSRLSSRTDDSRDGHRRKKSDVSFASSASSKVKRRARLYEPEVDAETIGEALNHTSARPGPLIDILPQLTHDQILALKKEYKKKFKVSGQGINTSKHIKAKTTGNFGKICYVTSLGKWESESYWANFWYQSNSSSRELLIEALMGKSNADIREIKDSFRDKRYNDSLSRCMEKELKADKFRTAVLLALEENRQEETDVWSQEYRNRDVDALHRAVTARQGGETAILQIVIQRSDKHLREVLKTYQSLHGVNFAKEALKKSNNLVGEVVAHILNGVINRPARDALLLHHAIDDIQSHNKAVELRYELLTSRLVRLHWERSHMVAVKEQYLQLYGSELESDLSAATKSDFGAFCLRLCET